MPFRRSLCQIKLAVPTLVLMLLLAGCADDGVVYDTPQNPVNGNWQVSASGSVPLPQISGSLTNGDVNLGTTPVKGIFHADATTGCATVTDLINVTGTTDDKGVTTLTGPVAGGTMTVTGTLSADGRSLANATVNVAGGQCAFPTAAQASVQNFSSVTGIYAGTFSDATGPVMNVTATLVAVAGWRHERQLHAERDRQLRYEPVLHQPGARGELAGLGRELHPYLHRQHEGQQRHGNGHLLR